MERMGVGVMPLTRLKSELSELLAALTAADIAAKLRFLKDWFSVRTDRVQRHPYNEIFAAFLRAQEGGAVARAQIEDIRWLCGKLLQSPGYVDSIAATMASLDEMLPLSPRFKLGSFRKLWEGPGEFQQLEAQTKFFSQWILNHEPYKRCWPFEDIDAWAADVLFDVPTTREQNAGIDQFVEDFLSQVPKPLGAGGEVAPPPWSEDASVPLFFPGKSFCLIGQSLRYNWWEFEEMIRERGGFFSRLPGSNTDYAIVGSQENPCWFLACYGRAVEQALEWKRAGSRPFLIHEHDFQRKLENGGP